MSEETLSDASLRLTNIVVEHSRRRAMEMKYEECLQCRQAELPQSEIEAVNTYEAQEKRYFPEETEKVTTG